MDGTDAAGALPRADHVLRAGEWSRASDACALDHEGRMLRRRVLRARGGLAFLADLPHATALGHGDALALEDGRVVEIVAADEDLLEVTGADLARLAWHIGNRHAACRIEPGRLVIRADRVMADMIARLGGTTRPLRAPFVPEGGAYGHGQVQGHPH